MQRFYDRLVILAAAIALVDYVVVAVVWLSRLHVRLAVTATIAAVIIVPYAAICVGLRASDTAKTLCFRYDRMFLVGGSLIALAILLLWVGYGSTALPALPVHRTATGYADKYDRVCTLAEYAAAKRWEALLLLVFMPLLLASAITFPVRDEKKKVRYCDDDDGISLAL